MGHNPPGSSVRNSPGKNTGVGYLALSSRGIFPTQGWKLHLLHCGGLFTTEPPGMALTCIILGSFLGHTEPQLSHLYNRSCDSSLLAVVRASLVAQWWRNHLRCRKHRFDPYVGRHPGVGNGISLQSSWLENPMNRGAWWFTVHGAATCWTWLSDWTRSGRVTKIMCISCLCYLTCYHDVFWLQCIRHGISWSWFWNDIWKYQLQRCLQVDIY